MFYNKTGTTLALLIHIWSLFRIRNTASETSPQFVALATEGLLARWRSVRDVSHSRRKREVMYWRRVVMLGGWRYGENRSSTWLTKKRNTLFLCSASDGVTRYIWNRWLCLGGERIRYTTRVPIFERICKSVCRKIWISMILFYSIQRFSHHRVVSSEAVKTDRPCFQMSRSLTHVIRAVLLSVWPYDASSYYLFCGW